MKNAAYRANVRKLVILAVLMVLAVVLYMVIDVNFANPKFLKFSMKIRTPKLLDMLVAAFAIGAATYFNDWEFRYKMLRTAEVVSGTKKEKDMRHYKIAEMFLVGEATVLAMRTNINKSNWYV